MDPYGINGKNTDCFTAKTFRERETSVLSHYSNELLKRMVQCFGNVSAPNLITETNVGPTTDSGRMDKEVIADSVRRRRKNIDSSSKSNPLRRRRENYDAST